MDGSLMVWFARLKECSGSGVRNQIRGAGTRLSSLAKRDLTASPWGSLQQSRCRSSTDGGAVWNLGQPQAWGRARRMTGVSGNVLDSQGAASRPPATVKKFTVQLSAVSRLLSVVLTLISSFPSPGGASVDRVQFAPRLPRPLSPGRADFPPARWMKSASSFWMRE